MATEKEEKLYQDRLKKLENLKKAGLDPYPAKGERTDTVAEALAQFKKLTSPSLAPARGGESSVSPPREGETKRGLIILAGRIKALRTHGGLIFGNIEDESGAMQFMLRQEDLGKDKFASFENFDIGDIFEAHGTLIETKRGEKTLLLTNFKILTKSLRALPDQYHGLKDVETKLRKRYLDLLANPDVREMFRQKSVFWKTVRDFMSSKGFLEVETPVLENVPGGAEAEPFVTHYNALDRDFYLRISLELPLKRLLVGGFEKVFELGRIFRNEGISTEHLQDYTQMEFYWAYADYNDLMKFLEELYRDVVKHLFGTTKVSSQGLELDWGKTWKRYDYYELFKKYAGLDLREATVKALKSAADKLKIKYEKFADKGRLIDMIYKKTVRPKLVEPGFLINPPVEAEPLAKRDPKDNSRVQRLQIMAWGTELGKGFSELNDPIDQRARFVEQMKLREQGDKEAQQLDEDFVEALEYGMPPAAGFGMSERFFEVLMDKSIRETVIFPPMKEGHHISLPRPGEGLRERSKKSQGKIPTREDALQLLHKHVKPPNLLKHMLATEALMRGLARKFGEDENKWGTAGLLHDIDYDETKDPKEHSLKGAAILEQEGIDSEIVDAVRIHNEAHGIEPVTLLDKALQTGETMTGFITACALVQPDKKLSSVNLDSAMKKYKSKGFAAGANRDIINKIEPYTGMSVKELMEICLVEMQGIADKLGL